MTEYSLAELTDAAGVSVRTVRYYVAEGLLPPPISAGPKSHYTQTHLDRLRLIGQLKASYLPLREIRRHLARLDDDDVRQLVENAEAAALTTQEEPRSDHVLADQLPPVVTHSKPIDSAADYLARVMSRSPDAGPPAPPTTHSPSPIPHEATSTWRRIPLGDDAELLIREEAYHRKHERIDWLIDWARKVLG